MSKRPVYIVLIIIACIATLAGSCKKGCGTCHSYGYNSTIMGYTSQVCSNTICTCPNGYEGDSCQILSGLKYFQPSATWSAYDGCSGNGSVYYVNMVSDYNTVTRFYINGLFNLGTQVAADIYSSGNNQGTIVNITQQTIGSITFYGQGNYQVVNGLGKLTLNIDYNQSGIESNCQVILYQQ